VTDRRRTTDFGFREVPWEDKANHVRSVFDSVADRYDVMNDLMSLGVHRLWKRFTIARARLGPGDAALDVAGGTGDLALGLAARVGPTGRVVLSDINHRMLARGRDRMLDEGVAGNVTCCVADAQRLPFPDRGFDCITIGFGLRNVTDKAAALAEFHRVLRPGGQLLVLEFSHPVLPGLAPIYDLYSFRVLPMLGKAVAGDAGSYRYLAESIRRHPDQDTLAGMLGDAGFGGTGYHNLTGGIVALHFGYRL
jgi:demethylmenaquinone methyltransferase/2-methoxy-6-polyprenyl-1,4-benzoquinol methylase